MINQVKQIPGIRVLLEYRCDKPMARMTLGSSGRALVSGALTRTGTLLGMPASINRVISEKLGGLRSLGNDGEESISLFFIDILCFS
jgi:hypothetical protein